MNHVDKILANPFQMKRKMKRNYTVLIGHKHYRSLQSQQWAFWTESVANCKHCEAIISLLFSGAGVWSKSGFKGLFYKLKRINIQYWPCCQSSMTSAAFKSTGYSEIGKSQTSVSSRQLGTLKKKQAPTGKIRFERSSNSELQVGNSF